MSVEVKGGTMMVNPELFIITSQYLPEQIWEDEETRAAIRRRVTIVFAEDNDVGNRPDVECLSAAVLPERHVGKGTTLGNYRTYTIFEKN